MSSNGAFCSKSLTGDQRGHTIAHSQLACITTDDSCFCSAERLGGNVTGVTNQGGDLIQKQLELLKATVPSVSRVAVLTTGQGAATRGTDPRKGLRMLEKAAKVLKVKLIVVKVAVPRRTWTRL